MHAEDVEWVTAMQATPSPFGVLRVRPLCGTRLDPVRALMDLWDSSQRVVRNLRLAVNTRRLGGA